MGPFTKFLLKKIIIYEFFVQVMRGILILTITKPLLRIIGKSKQKLMAFKRFFRIMTLALFAFVIRSEYFVNVDENYDISQIPSHSVCNSLEDAPNFTILIAFDPISIFHDPKGYLQKAKDQNFHLGSSFDCWVASQPDENGFTLGRG